MSYEKHTLENGVRIVLAPMPQAQSVTVALMYAAGSRYETRETNGIAESTRSCRTMLRHSMRTAAVSESFSKLPVLSIRHD